MGVCCPIAVAIGLSFFICFTCVSSPSPSPTNQYNTLQLVDWDFRHGMLRLYDDAALASASEAPASSPSPPPTAPFDGLLDYWPLPGTADALQAARLVVGVGTEAVGPNALVAVEVVVHGRKVRAKLWCLYWMCRHPGPR